MPGRKSPARTDLARADVDCAARLKILADPTRLRVVELLMGGPRRVAELQKPLAIDQSLLSHHLAVLRDAGLVESQRAGKGVVYRLAPDVELPASRAAIDLGCCQIAFAAPVKVTPGKATPGRLSKGPR